MTTRTASAAGFVAGAVTIVVVACLWTAWWLRDLFRPDWRSA